MNELELKNLSVTILPLDMAYSDKEANLNGTASLMNKMPADTCIAVLPELFSTGYIPDAEAARAMAEKNDGPTMQAMRVLAANHNCAVCGSFLALENDGSVRNRSFFIIPGGESYFYDKRHLFSLSGEGNVVSGGNEKSPIIDFMGWHISLAVCYDLRFPNWLRNNGCKYDVLIIPANWPEKRAFAWTHLLQARAIENQAYVIGANRSGSDAYGIYDNQSYISDYTGKMIQNSYGTILNAVLSKPLLEKYRNSFPFWKDAD